MNASSKKNNILIIVTLCICFITELKQTTNEGEKGKNENIAKASTDENKRKTLKAVRRKFSKKNDTSKVDLNTKKELKSLKNSNI